MKNTPKKLIASVLAGLMLMSAATAFSSCAENKDNLLETVPESIAEDKETDTPYAVLKKEKWNGQTLTVLCRDDTRRSLKLKVTARMETQFLMIACMSAIRLSVRTLMSESSFLAPAPLRR